MLMFDTGFCVDGILNLRRPIFTSHYCHKIETEMTSSLASIENPIAIFSEHIASRPTTLRFKNHGRGGSTITDITDETAHQNLFTVGAKQTGMTSSRREFRDSKESLLFEMRRDRTGYYTFLERFHDPSHPFATFDPLATGCKDKFDVSLHRSARDGDSLLEPEIKLEVRGQDIWKKNALVYCGEDIIMQVRLVHLYTCYVPFKSNEWDVYVAKGMDLSLVSFVSCC